MILGVLGGVSTKLTLFLGDPTGDPTGVPVLGASYSYQTALTLRFNFFGPGLMRPAMALNEAVEAADWVLAVSDMAT